MALACKAQVYTVENLKKRVIAKYNTQPDSLNFCDFVVIDGVPYSFSDIENGKKELTAEELRVFLFVKAQQLSPHMKCDWLLILGSGEYQKKKAKKELLSKLKENLNSCASGLTIYDKFDSCMAVVVGGKALNEAESIQLVKKLKAGRIAYIALYQNANPDYYGYRARNGIVEIFLKE